MAEIRILDDDIIRLYELGKPRRAENLIATLFWGDTVNVVDKQDGEYVIELWRRVWDAEKRHYVWQKRTGSLPSKTRFRALPLLKVRFVDVGQGDAVIVESPQGRVVLIDGGEEEHLRRYINVAYSHILRNKPLHCDALVVTHGDADHFAGLAKLIEGFRSPTSPLITADRVFHSGLVKKTDDRISEAFGATAKVDGTTYAVQLEDNLLEVPDDRMNRPFKAWKKALKKLDENSGMLTIQRLQYGDDGAFGFLLPEEIVLKVLGPIVEEIQGKPALRFLRASAGGRSLSIAHTINGHSIVLRLTYRNVNFLFGADLNEESEERLVERARNDHLSLTGEVFKVPHHGSADFSPTMLEAVRPVVSVVSSGDECTSKEYIHPRAGLMGALGKYSRASVTKPLVYVTEMVAFFERLGEIEATQITPSGGHGDLLGRIHNAYWKKTFGMVHIRTDGERVLVATHSGRDDQKESYAFHVDGQGGITFEKETRII
jgi:beta-lactamase superfamily II metal-dependent hydrolase